MEIIGHERNKKYFRSLIKNGSLGHAYLFSGPEMIGKKTFALEIFKALNAREPINDPDFILISPKITEGESKIYIEDIRKLKSFFHLKPYAGPYRLALVDDAHTLTGEASNALLKLLEEPPAFSLIVVVSSMPGLILPTISSRCEKISFNELDKKEIQNYLAGKDLKKEEKDFLAILSVGRIGLIDNIVKSNNIAEAHKAIDDLRKLLISGVNEKMSYAKKINEKEAYQPTVGYWLSWVSAHLTGSPKNEKIVKNLLSLSYLISQPQYNHRLALENFLLSL